MRKFISFFKPSTISLYILREQLPPILVGLAFFTFVLLVNKVVILLSLLIEKNVPVSYSLELFLLMIPFTMALTVPVAILMGTVMAMGRLSSDSEIIAMRASGISYFRIYRSLIAMGLLYTFVMVLFNNYLLPYANRRYRILYDEISRSQPVSLVDAAVFNVIPGQPETLYTESISKKTKEMKNVLIIREKPDKTREIILADRGQWLDHETIGNLKQLRLFTGSAHTANITNGKYSIVDFSKGYSDFNMLEKGIGYTGASRDARSEREKSMEEIFVDLRDYKKKNPDRSSHQVRHEIANRELEFWKHLSIPFASLALTLIGAPLGIVSHRSGKGLGFGFAIIVTFIYYLILMTGERMVNALQMRSWIGAWMPVFVVSLFGIIMIYFRNSAENVMEGISDMFRRFARRFKNQKD